MCFRAGVLATRRETVSRISSLQRCRLSWLPDLASFVLRWDKWTPLGCWPRRHEYCKSVVDSLACRQIIPSCGIETIGMTDSSLCGARLKRVSMCIQCWRPSHIFLLLGGVQCRTQCRMDRWAGSSDNGMKRCDSWISKRRRWDEVGRWVSRLGHGWFR